MNKSQATLPRSSRSVLLFLMLLALDLSSVPLAQAQKACGAALVDAEQKYRSGEWDEAINLVNH